MSLPIWIYWEGEMPDVIKLCVNTIQRFNGDVRIVGPKEIAELGGQEVLDQTDFKLQPRTGNVGENVAKAIRSDLMRYWLIFQYGGIWLDADMICLDKLDLLEGLENWDIVACRNIHVQPNPAVRSRMLAAPFGAAPGSPIIKAALDMCTSLVRRMMIGQYIPYSKTSVGVLSRAMHGLKIGQKAKIVEHWRYNRVAWSNARVQYTATRKSMGHEFSDSFNPNACIYHLTNPVTFHFLEHTTEQLMTGKTFLTFLFQKAFQLHPAVPHRSLEILKRLPSGPAKMVEIGVFKGENSRNLLSLKKDLTHLGVDPFDVIGDPTYRATGDHVAFKKTDEWKSIYGATRRGLSFAGVRSSLLKMTSVDAALSHQETGYDMVFIDGNHSYSGCQADIDAWADRVKVGGYVAGHDYGNPRFPGVKKSVDEYAAKIKSTVELGEDNTWFIKKGA